MGIPVNLLLSSQKHQGVPFFPKLSNLHLQAPLVSTPFLRNQVMFKRSVLVALPIIMRVKTMYGFCYHFNNQRFRHSNTTNYFTAAWSAFHLKHIVSLFVSRELLLLFRRKASWPSGVGRPVTKRSACRRSPEASMSSKHMSCYVMLCYIMLCYGMLCYAMLGCVMLCYVMLCYAII